MKKQLLAKIAGIAGAVALLSGATFAYFTSNAVTIENVTLASANPALEIYDKPNNGWSTDDVVDLGINESNMYPGRTGEEHKFLLRNTTGGGVPFTRIFPSIVSGSAGSSDWEELKDVVEMRFAETGAKWTGWGKLSWWLNNTADMLFTSLDDGAGGKEFKVQFRMLSTADDKARGKNLHFDLSFVAQTP